MELSKSNVFLFEALILLKTFQYFIMASTVRLISIESALDSVKFHSPYIVIECIAPYELVWEIRGIPLGRSFFQKGCILVK